LDLADPKEAGRWVAKAIDAFGHVDILYNNAAGLRFVAFEEASLEDWDFTVRNELTITFVAAKAVWPHFKRQGAGVILNVASVAGHRELAVFPCAAHGAVNAGIIALTRTMAAAGAPYGIRAVSISPGIVNNPNVPPPLGDPNSVESRRLWGPTPMGRPAHIAEIINTALFLASEEASYITGTDIAVDGGMSGTICAVGRQSTHRG
jgi:meso-butanediol dehydrogenase/(S,S)-butanediol dehydrogenase/diacetyl reductase